MDIRGIQVDMLQRSLTQPQRSQILDLSPIVQAVANSDETKKSSVYEIKSKFEIRSPPELDLGPICRHVAVDIVNGLGGNCGLFNLLGPLLAIAFAYANIRMPRGQPGLLQGAGHR